jgi:hypothetical protein
VTHERGKSGSDPAGLPTTRRWTAPGATPPASMCRGEGPLFTQLSRSRGGSSERLPLTRPAGGTESLQTPRWRGESGANSSLKSVSSAGLMNS